LYPPGRVPLGVTVHVNEDDGDVNIDTPSSLQVFVAAIPVLYSSSCIFLKHFSDCTYWFFFSDCIVVVRFLSTSP
jgi:hypothetical protein